MNKWLWLPVNMCLLTMSVCLAQSGGPPCDGQPGCEAIHRECPVPLTQLNEVDTLPDFRTDANRMLLKGVVYRPDGRTPAPNVIVYIYHTNQQGIYPKQPNLPPVGRWHGYLRGWVKTNVRGEYRFYTAKPAPYPTHDIPAHIHMHVKEPGKANFWIDDTEFSDDPLLSPAERRKRENRAGPGIITLRREGNLLVADRTVILGENIPGY